jgi:hypothetical protein
MSHNELRSHIIAVPFRPFVLHISDGRTITVHARDFIMISPLGSTVDVYQPDEEHDILASGAITGISFAPPSPQTSSEQTANSN